MARLRALGFQVMRTAASHGLFDVIGITTIEQGPGSSGLRGFIKLVQCKSGKTQEKAKKKALKALKQYEGTYQVTVEVR